MSELYRIKIKSVKDYKVRTEIKIVHPDAGTKFESKDFALQILLYTADERMYWNHLPLSKEEWKKSIQNHPRKAELDKLQSCLNGQKILITEAEYEQLSKDRDFYEAKNKELKEQYGFTIRSYGFFDENWYIQLPPNNVAIIDEAYRIIDKKPKKSTAKDENGKAIKKTYYLDFEVIDAQYLVHLIEGMEYETAAYELESYEVYYHNYKPPKA